MRKDTQATYSWGILAMIALLAALAAGGMIYVKSEVAHLTVQQTPLVSTIEDVRLNTTLAHLGFEEILGGDSTEDISAVWQHLDSAQRSLHTLRQKMLRPQDTSLRAEAQQPGLSQRLADVQQQLAAFRALAEKRLRVLKISGDRTLFDAEFDTLFAEIMMRLAELDSGLRTSMNGHLARFEREQNGLAAAVALFGGFALILFIRLDGRRRADFMALQQAERGQREARGYLQAVYQASPDMIFVHAADGRLVDVNNRVLKAYGMTREQMLAADPSMVMGRGYTLGKAMEYIRRALAGEPLDVDWVARRADGTEFPVEVRLRRLPVDDGEARVLAVVRDISALRESEEKFRILAEEGLAGVYLIQDGVFQYANPRLAEMFGYTPEELIGHLGPEALVAEEDRAMVAENIRKRLDGKIDAIHYGFRGLTRQGRQIDVEVYGARTLFHGRPAVLGTLLDVTERRGMEEALARNEAHFRSLIENAQDLITIIDTGGRISYTSPSVEHVLGYGPEELIGQPALEMIHPDDRDNVGLKLAAIFDEPGSSQPMTYRFRHKDGDWLEFEAIAHCHRDEDGALRGVFNARDITQRRRAERSLTETRQMLQLVLDTVPVRIFWKDTNSVYLGCNLAFAKDAGLNHPDEVIGKTDMELPWRKQAELYRADDRQVTGTGVPKLDYEEPQVHPDGTHMWLKTSKLPLKDADGRIIGVLGCYEDITARKLAEKELRLTQFFIESAPDAAYWMDDAGHFLYVNDTACRCLGYTREELLNMSVADIDPNMADGLPPEMTAATKKRGYGRVESEHRAKDGRIFPVEVMVIYTTYEGQGYHLAFARDISERKKAEAAVRDSEQRYRSLFENGSRAIIVFDAETLAIEDANAAACRLLGYTKKELLALTPLALHDEKEHPRLKELIVTALADQEARPHVPQLHYRCKDGAYFIGEFYGGCYEAHGRRKLFAVIEDISERVQAEEAIKESQARYAEAQWLAKLGHWSLDLVQNKLSWSDEVYRIFEIDPKQFGASYEAFLDMVHPEDREMVDRTYKASVKNKAPYEVTHRLKLRDGTIKYVNERGRTFYAEDDTPLRSIGTVQDITERQLAEQQLRASEENFRVLFEDSPVSLWLEDLSSVKEFIGHLREQGIEDLAAYCNAHPEAVRECVAKVNVLDVNRATLELYRAKNKQQLLANLAVTFTDESFAVFRDEMLRLAAGASEVEQEAVTQTLDGERLYVILRASIAPGHEARWDKVLVSITDITARKKAEQEMAQLAAAVEQATDIIFITDAKATILYANPAFAAAYGYSQHEIAGQPAKILKSDEHDEAYHRKLSATLDAGQAWSGDLINKAKDGNLVEVECTITPIRDAQGRVQNFVAIQRDVSQERALREQLEHIQRLESLGVLAGGIAHDFNNILTAIMGNASMAESELEALSPAADYLGRIVAASERAADLCKQMLAYSGKGKFVVKPIDLSELVEEMTRLLEVSIAKNVVLKFHLADNLPAVEADLAQIQQVIMNLITNASDAIGDKSGVISITTGVMNADREYLATTFPGEKVRPGRFAFLEVADTGCGMDDEIQKKIFDPFFTTKFTGRGLGMSAVLGIVRGHKGAIKLYSEPNRGTTFKVLLPCVEQKAVPLTKNDKREDTWQGSGTVLVVDDEESIREVAAMMLGGMGFAVLAAEDGEEGVAMYREHRDEIVAVLLDMTMPRMTGEEAFRELRRIDPDVKVILSSGYNEQDAVGRFAGKGLAGFIQKPYSPQALAAKMREVLDEPE